MIRDRALALLRQVAAGEVPPERALASFASGAGRGAWICDGRPFTGPCVRDIRRSSSAPGKTPEETAAIAATLADRGEGFLVTRANAAHRGALAARFRQVEVNEVAQTVYQAAAVPLPLAGQVLIVTAGTSDASVAEEAAVTARALGNSVSRATDVGVAGLHRIVTHRDALAGMRT